MKKLFVILFVFALFSCAFAQTKLVENRPEWAEKIISEHGFASWNIDKLTEIGRATTLSWEIGGEKFIYGEGTKEDLHREENLKFAYIGKIGETPGVYGPVYYQLKISNTKLKVEEINGLYYFYLLLDGKSYEE